MELISTEIIRKQDATNALFPLKSKYVLDPIRDAVVTECIKEIDNIAGIERRPKGKWIVDRYCSCCEWDKHDFEYIGGWRENFCPACGADMRGKK